MKKTKKLKFLFIYPDLDWNNINFSPAILAISAYLKKNADIDVELIHINEKHGIQYNLADILKRVRDISPDIIGFTCTTYQYHYVEEIAEYLKKNGVTAPLVLGGSHATITAEDIKDSAMDAFCIGEGEIPILEFCKRIQSGEDRSDIAGFILKKDGEIIKNPPAQALANLNDMPMRDYELMDTPKILEVRNGWFNIAFSRGCPYSCTFCVNQVLRKIYKANNEGNYFRCQSVDRVIEELVHWVNRYKGLIKVFNFDDDLLMLKKDWFIEFAAKYKESIYEKFGIKYVINGRANLIDSDIADALASSGCHEVQIGFESGNDELRNRMLKKQITNSQLMETFSLLRKKKIRTLAYTILGIPGENHLSVRETVKVLGELKPTLIRMTIFDPFRGTPLYDYCKEHDLFKKDSKIQGNHFAFSNLNFDDLNDLDILQYHLFFPWYLNQNVAQCKDAIEEFGKLSFDELLKSREKILAADKKISEELTKNKRPHFRYFDKNQYYYQYVDFD